MHSTLTDGTQSLTVDGQSSVSKTQTGTLNTGLNLYLFGCNNNGTSAWLGKARCYALKLWEGETLVRDFRPCVKLGQAALYDQVSGRIFRSRNGKLLSGRTATPGKPDYFVTFVGSKGRNVLDTGVRGRSGTRSLGTYSFLRSRWADDERIHYMEIENECERSILAACKDGLGGRFYMVHAPNTQLWVGYGEVRVYPEYTETVDGVETTNRYKLYPDPFTVDATYEQGNQTVVLNGQTIHAGTDESLVDTEQNLYLFACNKDGWTIYNAWARCYGLKLWQDGALVRDFRPCVKNGAAGFYDAVQNEVVYPRGIVPQDCIGSPIYSDDMKPAQVLEYVDSDGTQWIDTGVTGRVDTVAEFKMAWLYRVDNPDDGFLGSRRDDGKTRFYMWHNAHNDQSFGYGDFMYVNLDDPARPNWRDDSGHAVIVNGTPLHVKTSFLAESQSIVVDGVKVLDIALEGNLDTKYPMYLFAENTYGTAVNKCAARLYEMRIWQDGKLVRHFLPVLLDSGLAAVYDTVEEKVYPPQGSGLFAGHGPVVGEYKQCRRTVILVR